MSAPKARPPTNSTTKLSPASRSENDPVAAAAMANWKQTMPEASFKSSSPLRMPHCRSGMLTCFDRDVTATASVGPKAAPKANAAAKEMAGMIACKVKPMINMVTTTSPMASERIGPRFFQRMALSAFFASIYKSGAMKSTRNRSGSSSMTMLPRAKMAMMMPRPTWMRGSDTLGMTRSATADMSTAMARSSTSVNVSMSYLFQAHHAGSLSSAFR